MRRIVLAVVLFVVLPGPALASDASTAWMTNPQHNGELTDSPVRPPLAVRWDIRLGTVTSNVLVADGRVIFVRADATGAPQLTAVDAATGAHLWSVVTPTARDRLRRRPGLRHAGLGHRRVLGRHRRAAVDARPRGRLRRPARSGRRRDGLRARRRAGIEGGRRARDGRRRAVDVDVAVVGGQLADTRCPAGVRRVRRRPDLRAEPCHGPGALAPRHRLLRRRRDDGRACTAAACTRRRGPSRSSIPPRAR